MTPMTTRLAVPDVSCQNCQQAIEGALAPLRGVDRAEADVASRVVTVVHDPALDSSELVRVVEDQGYEVAACDREEP